MAKLTQDEIKWILSIDAKGVNKEIAVTSSEINKLSQANKVMAADMKAAEKQIKETEKAMEKLAKAGQQESEAYRELKSTRDSARADIDDYTRKIGENNRAITENKKKIEELTAGMDINEMSMKQLRQRAAELKMQLNATSASANPKEFQALQKDLEKVNSRMFDVGNQGKGLLQQFAAMNNPVGSAAQSVIGFGQALKGLIANPAGIVIMAIVAAFYALKTAIMGSDEATTKYEAAVAALGTILDALKRNVVEVVGAFINLITLDFAGFKENARNIADINKNLVDNAKSAWDAAIAEDALNDSIARNNDVTEVNKARIAELRQISRDVTKSIDERKKASDEALKLERDNYKMSVSNISGQYDVWKGKNKNLIDAMKRDSHAQFLEVEKYMQMVQDGTELTYEQRLELARLVNDITATLDKGTEEEKEKFRSFFSELSTMQEQYFTENRRDVVAAARIEDEARRNAEQNAKEALERKISEVDYSLKEETKLLKQQLADRSITQEQYDRELEQKTLESLQRKLEIAGLEKDARIDIEQQILDFKIKAIELEKQLEKERADMAKNVRTSFMDKDNQELEAIREKYNKRNEDLRLSLEKEVITELEYNEYKAILLEEQETELEEKRKTQRETKAAQKLIEQNEEYEAEKMQLMEQYANGLLDKQTYNDLLLKLDEEYALRSLEISNLSDKEKLAARQKLLDMMIKKNEEETKKQEEEQKKRAALYAQFSEQIGTMLGGIIAGNEDIVKSSLKTIINMALDALEAQITMAIASATAQSFAQADSVATFGASGAARAAILTALIKGAFAGVKAIVNSKLSGSKSSQPDSVTTTTGSRVITGRQSGGFFNVSREQDGKKYIAKFDPTLRGFIKRPTVLVGDGPIGKSQEWVASNDALQNPTVAPFIRLLNDAQQAGTIRTIDLNHLMRARMAGFQSGGFLYDNPIADAMRNGGSSDPSLFLQKNGSIDPIMTELRDLLQHLKTNGVKAPIVLSELQRKQELLNVSQQIGSK
mgnify:CR=1 FL=1